MRIQPIIGQLVTRNDSHHSFFFPQHPSTPSLHITFYTQTHSNPFTDAGKVRKVRRAQTKDSVQLSEAPPEEATLEDDMDSELSAVPSALDAPSAPESSTSEYTYRNTHAKHAKYKSQKALTIHPPHSPPHPFPNNNQPHPPHTTLLHLTLPYLTPPQNPIPNHNQSQSLISHICQLSDCAGQTGGG